MRFNAGITASPATRRIRFTQPLSLASLTALPVARAMGVTESVIDRDANLERTSGVRVTDYQMRLESFGGSGGVSVTWTTSNPAVATVDADGFVLHVSNGSATITALAGGLTEPLTLTFSSVINSSSDELTGYVTGSLAANVTAAVDSRIAGKTAATALPVFTTQNHTGGVYVRNSQCWAADVDLTPISPWNSVGANTRAGTLVSPRHVIFAAHYPAIAGMTIRFVQADNTVVTRTVSAVLTHPSYTPYFPDIQVGVLNADVPVGIGFARVLPANWATRLPAINVVRSLPCLCLDQEEKALVTDLSSLGTSANFVAPSQLNFAQRLAFYEAKIGGDSGNPAFLVVNNQLVLLTVWTFGGAGAGTFITPQIAAINTMMTTLGGGYQLTEIDLSSFPTY